jgi:hypothetical protein
MTLANLISMSLFTPFFLYLLDITFFLWSTNTFIESGHNIDTLIPMVIWQKLIMGCDVVSVSNIDMSDIKHGHIYGNQTWQNRI